MLYVNYNKHPDSTDDSQCADELFMTDVGCICRFFAKKNTGYTMYPMFCWLLIASKNTQERQEQVDDIKVQH